MGRTSFHGIGNFIVVMNGHLTEHVLNIAGFLPMAIMSMTMGVKYFAWLRGADIPFPSCIRSRTSSNSAAMARLPMVPDNTFIEIIMGTPLDCRMEKILAKRDMMALMNREPTRGIRRSKASLKYFPRSVLRMNLSRQSGGPILPDPDTSKPQ